MSFVDLAALQILSWFVIYKKKRFFIKSFLFKNNIFQFLEKIKIMILLHKHKTTVQLLIDIEYNTKY